MGRTCTVCGHEARTEIDEALVTGSAVDELARRYRLKATSLRRHRDGHLPVALVAAKQAGDAAQAGKLVDRVSRLAQDLETDLATARRGGNLDVSLRILRELRGYLELLGRVTGELQTGTRVLNLQRPQMPPIGIVRIVIPEGTPPEHLAP